MKILAAVALLFTPTQASRATVVPFEFVCHQPNSENLATMQGEVSFEPRSVDLPDNFLTIMNTCGYSVRDLVIQLNRKLQEQNMLLMVVDVGRINPNYHRLQLTALYRS